MLRLQGRQNLQQCRSAAHTGAVLASYILLIEHQSKQFELNYGTDLGDSFLSRANILQKSLKRQHEELVLNSATSFPHQRPSLLGIDLLPLLLRVVLCVHMGVVVLGAGLIHSIPTQPAHYWLGCVKIQGSNFEWDLDLATHGQRVRRILQ